MKLFKKVFAVLLVLLLIAGCSNDAGTDGGASSKTIDELKVVFVPSRDAQDIEKQTEPLKELLQTELAKSGYEVASVAIETMTSYEAAGEALSAGSAHIGLIPGGTYAAFYDKGVNVILASTRNGLKYDTENPQDWNTGEANENNEDIVTYYRGIIIAGPSEKGQDLAQKAKDDALTWDEVSTAKWCVSSPSSGSGYQYPAVWLNDRFEQSLPNMAENTVTTQGYGDAAAKLANEQCDVAPGYNDFRMDNDEAWVSEFGLENIWTETSIIGVTDKIQNDTVSVSAELVDDELATAIADAFINLAGTEAGAEAIKIYNHNGYQKVTDADYEGAKKVNELVKSWNE
ncbi:MAG TPA: PhnD/SsuA/transferrin family substrate-binding protein [Erysipelothrix sp.]|jgi:phosphonate transport system substrate-binding protein|nr:PhnD/SsuA/transferrin family substrate-binding protein [Erysipelothrix sp.]